MTQYTVDELQAHTKEYVAKIALGATTPSFDLETEVDATYPTEHITRELVDDTLKRFTGAISQIPPAFSACKVNGERAYKRARRGDEVTIRRGSRVPACPTFSFLILSRRNSAPRMRFTASKEVQPYGLSIYNISPSKKFIFMFTRLDRALRL